MTLVIIELIDRIELQQNVVLIDSCNRIQKIRFVERFTVRTYGATMYMIRHTTNSVAPMVHRVVSILEESFYVNTKCLFLINR